MNRFEGKTILVTGAGSGIGAACVRRLHAEGAAVAAADLKKTAVEEVASGLGDPRRILAMAVDVSDPKQTDAFVSAAVARFGKLHGLVNCAGVRGIGTVLDTEPEAFRRVVSVNLEGTFNTCQAFARAAKDDRETKRSIVNITSAAGIRGIPNRLSYAASKFGVSGISRSMALELGPAGIRVNAIAPGMIRTPMTAGMFADPENAKRIRADHPVGRAGEPEDIAAAVAFLLSEDAGFITGVVLPVDGGMTTGIPSR